MYLCVSALQVRPAAAAARRPVVSLDLREDDEGGNAGAWRASLASQTSLCAIPSRRVTCYAAGQGHSAAAVQSAHGMVMWCV